MACLLAACSSGTGRPNPADSVGDTSGDSSASTAVTGAGDASDATGMGDAVCGNGGIEQGEECDDANLDPGDGCDEACFEELPGTDAFRITRMEILDPHFFLSVAGFCRDLTNEGLDPAPSVNEVLTEAFNADSGGDGFLDLGVLLLFRPLKQTGFLGGQLDLASADCTAPVETTACDLQPDPGLVPTKFDNDLVACLRPQAADLSPAGYSPAPGPAPGPCFSSRPISFTFAFSTVPIPLQRTELAAQYVGDPASGLIQGRVRGFLTEADAQASLISPTIAVVGGMTIDELLPDDVDEAQGGNCADHSDLDLLDGTIRGWWFYAEFEAERANYVGP